MKLILILFSLFSLSFAATCQEGYFSKGGDKCNYACSPGCKDEKCDDTGKCLVEQCEEGWVNGNDRDAIKDGCTTPICFGGRKCDNGGKCVAPNTCICGESGAQVVAKYGEFASENGKDMIEGTDCVSLRKDGIKGAFVALVVMMISISTCGFIAEKNGQAK